MDILYYLLVLGTGGIVAAVCGYALYFIYTILRDAHDERY